MNQMELQKRIRSIAPGDTQALSKLVLDIKQEMLGNARHVYALSETMETAEVALSGKAIDLLWRIQEVFVQIALDSFKPEDADIGLDHLEKALGAFHGIRSEFARQIEKSLSDKRIVDMTGCSATEDMMTLRVCDCAFLSMQKLLRGAHAMSVEQMRKLDSAKRDWQINKARGEKQWVSLLHENRVEASSTPE
jgi:hypothetical protein